MAALIRKQIYIKKRQAELIKRLARLRGVSEAEIIRQSIERQIENGAGPFLPPDSQAWERAHKMMVDLHSKGPLTGHGRQWTREDLYEGPG